MKIRLKSYGQAQDKRLISIRRRRNISSIIISYHQKDKRKKVRIFVDNFPDGCTMYIQVYEKAKQKTYKMLVVGFSDKKKKNNNTFFGGRGEGRGLTSPALKI